MKFKKIKIFTLDSSNLIYKRNKKFELFIISLVLIIIFLVSSTITNYLRSNNTEPIITELERTIVIREFTEFSEKKLINEIKSNNFYYPHIIYAQAILETNNFRSDIFIENHNLFGMKQAALRPNTALGENRNHAYYSNWRKSLIDRAYYECRIFRDRLSEEQYYDVLKQSGYAEDENYIPKLKEIVRKQKLEELFKN